MEKAGFGAWAECAEALDGEGVAWVLAIEAGLAVDEARRAVFHLSAPSGYGASAQDGDGDAPRRCWPT
jgi:hypothetical protein